MRHDRSDNTSLTAMLVIMVGALMLCILLIPAKPQTKRDGDKATCTSNLQMIGRAMAMYSKDYDDMLMPCNMGSPKKTWHFLIRPYLSPKLAHDSKTTVFFCPADSKPYDQNGYASGCQFSYGYNNTAGDGERLKIFPNEWTYQYKHRSQVPPQTALVTEVNKNDKSDWMRWGLSDCSAKSKMLFPHENEDGPVANILFIEGNVVQYSKYAMEDIHQWKIYGKRKPVAKP